MISPDTEFVVDPTVVMTPSARLPAAVRADLGAEAIGAIALSRPRSRASSTLIDDALAELLEEFRAPSTIADAVARFSVRHRLDAADVLVASYGALRDCVVNGYLVHPESEAAAPRRALVLPGTHIGRGTVLRTIRMFDDVELHQLALDDGGFAALKVVRAMEGDQRFDALGREAAVLRHLDGRVAPRLIDAGETDELRWLAIEWCDGPTAARLSTMARTPAGADLRLDAAIRVAEAIADLHELGVVHGDVHPGNIVVGSSGPARVIDFALATVLGLPLAGGPPPRGGVPAFYDPGHAVALLAERDPPAATAMSDQYSLGAVLYQLITGASYLTFSADPRVMLQRIAEDDPLPFVSHDRIRLPAEVEQIVLRALAKDPGDRHASARDLAERLAAFAPPDEARRSVQPSRSATGLVETVIAKVAPGGSWFEDGLPRGTPTSNVAHGAAGIAAALLRLATIRSDASLLSLADEWSARAQRSTGRADAFAAIELGFSEADVGPISPYHCRSGVHAVGALVNHALDDGRGWRRDIGAFVTASLAPCGVTDLMLGRAGTMLACAILRETSARSPSADSPATALGDSTMAELWAEIDATPPIAEGRGMTYLGVAHGWAGVLVATLRWCAASGAVLPSTVVDRLDQLAQLARIDGISAHWPVATRHHGLAAGAPLPGWCHGSAGYVHLWTTAARVLDDERWIVLAEQAAWHSATTPTAAGQLCCGACGQAYALLELYGCTGERRWLTSARELTERAVATVTSISDSEPLRSSLYKGEIGVAVLTAELDEPDLAVMPFFGRAG